MQPPSPLARLGSQKQARVFGGGADKPDRSISFGAYKNHSDPKRTNSELNSSVQMTDEQDYFTDKVDGGGYGGAGKADLGPF